MSQFNLLLIAAAVVLLAQGWRKRVRSRQCKGPEFEPALVEHLLCDSPAATMVLDDTNVIRYSNTAAAELFEYDVATVLGKPLSFLASRESSDAKLHDIQQLMRAAPKCAAFEIKGRTRQGSDFPLQLKSRCVEFRGKQWIVVAMRDLAIEVSMKHALQRYVNQLVCAKESLQQYNNDLQGLVHQQTADLLVAKERAEEAKAAQSEFLANMSHELRTPLHGILSFARFGTKKFRFAEREKLASYFQRIESAGQTLLKLLNALLDLSKLESRAVTLDCEKVSITAALREITEEFFAIAREKDLTIGIADCQTDGWVWGDADQLRQVIRNLLGNAVKFTPSGGEICIALAEQGMQVVVSIRDTGPGIPDEECERVFDKFVQSHLTRTGAGGTGLGLSICREIIRLHDGAVRAVPTHGHGALLQLCLPRYVPEDDSFEPQSNLLTAAIP